MLHEPEKVAANSLIIRRINQRTRFNPYKKQLLKRAALLRRPWVKNNEDLLHLLKESGAENGFHIAIPVFESAEEAERIYQEMSARLKKWSPSYQPMSLTAGNSEQITNDEKNDKSQVTPRARELQ